MLTTFFKRRTALIAPLLILASAAFGQEFEKIGSVSQARPAPARKTTASSQPSTNFPCEIESWVSCDIWGDFLYWQALQENMEPCGTFSSFIQTGFTGSNNTELVNMNFEYKPAFRVGLGIGLDHEYLDLTADYTRFYSTDKVSGGGNNFYPMQLDSATLLAFLNGINTASGGYGNAFPYSFKQSWTLKMNLFDFNLGKMNYDGKTFKGHTFFGLRGSLIDQQLSANYTANLANGGGAIGTANTSLKTKSWGVGIRAGLDTDWKMGGGFQFYGNGSGDILYSRYHFHGTSNATVSTATPYPVNWNTDVKQNNINAIRLHTELEMGFKWSHCFNDNNVRLDFGAGYGFQVFFDQNMFRFSPVAFEQNTIVGAVTELSGITETSVSIEPNGNLYIHGLRATAGITF